MMNHSIRRRLLLTLLSAMAMVWLATSLTSFLDSRHEVGELFDAELAQSARTLLALSRHELQELLDEGRDWEHVHYIPEHRNNEEGHRYEHKLAYQIWLVAGAPRLLMRSDNAPETPFSDIHEGYSDHNKSERRWRVFSLVGPNGQFMVQMAQDYGIRDELSGHIALRILMPMLAALPLLAFLVWYGVGRSLRPLVRLADEVGARAPSNLTPLDLASAPEESRPLVRAINRLFARLEQAFENERRFTADAAHELRTPLAALKTQAQVALRSDDDESRRRALEQVQRGVDRATRLVEQLLTLARLDPDTPLAATTEVDLCAVAIELLADADSDARARNIELSLNDTCQARLTGHATSLAILLRNLVDNAVRYTPVGGQVEVGSRQVDGRTVFYVGDSGPGIAAAARAQVFERFYRGEGNQAEGSGLGLSITKRIAQLHGLDLSLEDSPLGGLEVRLTLPVR